MHTHTRSSPWSTDQFIKRLTKIHLHQSILESIPRTLSSAPEAVKVTLQHLYTARVHIRLIVVVRLLTERTELKYYLILPHLVSNVILLQKLHDLMRLHLVVLRREELLLLGQAASVRPVEHLEVAALYVRGRRGRSSRLSSLLSEGVPGQLGLFLLERERPA